MIFYVNLLTQSALNEWIVYQLNNETTQEFFKRNREKQLFKLQTPLTQTQDMQFSYSLQQNIWRDWQRFATQQPSMDYSFR